MTKEEFDKITYGVRDGNYILASNLTRAEAGALIRRLEEETKRNGTYYEDRFVLMYRLPS